MSKRSFLIRFVRDAWTLVVPLVLCLLGAIVLMVLGYHDAAWIVGNLGAVVVVLVNAIYVLVWDPRGRWKRTP